jgi:hypothetical protein
MKMTCRSISEPFESRIRFARAASRAQSKAEDRVDLHSASRAQQTSRYLTPRNLGFLHSVAGPARNGHRSEKRFARAHQIPAGGYSVVTDKRDDEPRNPPKRKVI